MRWLFDHRRFGLGLGLGINLISSPSFPSLVLPRTFHWQELGFSSSLPRLALASGLAVGGWWGEAGGVVFRFLCYNKIKKMRQKKLLYYFLILFFLIVLGFALDTMMKWIAFWLTN